MSRVVVVAPTIQMAERFSKKILPLLDRWPALVSFERKAALIGLRNAVVFFVNCNPDHVDFPEDWYRFNRSDINVIKVQE